MPDAKKSKKSDCYRCNIVLSKSCITSYDSNSNIGQNNSYIIKSLFTLSVTVDAETQKIIGQSPNSATSKKYPQEFGPLQFMPKNFFFQLKRNISRRQKRSLTSGRLVLIVQFLIRILDHRNSTSFFAFQN